MRSPYTFIAPVLASLAAAGAHGMTELVLRGPLPTCISGGASAGATAIATLLAFVVGYASIAFLLRYLVHHSIGIFAAYRIALGLLVIALAATNVIS